MFRLQGDSIPERMGIVDYSWTDRSSSWSTERPGRCRGSGCVDQHNVAGLPAVRVATSTWTGAALTAGTLQRGEPEIWPYESVLQELPLATPRASSRTRHACQSRQLQARDLNPSSTARRRGLRGATARLRDRRGLPPAGPINKRPTAAASAVGSSPDGCAGSARPAEPGSRIARHARDGAR